MDTPSSEPKCATEQDRLVGERIKVLRKSKGISQTALGSALGVTFQQIQKYENGVNRVGASRLSEVARVLEVPVSTFFEEGGGLVEQGQQEVFEFLRVRGAVDLLNAFIAIEDDQLRREVLALVRCAARMKQKQRT
ncbi:helix-turn-helix domain-containing protein [Methylorubrum extorquens]|uniref:Transcriptional regulator, XRE family n=1 Tax=Methylorubrum extorquens (strain CM4 / NCIMB 13688) TaxID=440085 RepID=B7KSD3_METC4|nr:helix-turn-helix transcriptional regulator [Methylorubrum extorquens]ACK85601.1 transcriptional regulator, XRE family [Methylorubrum extorquens CM4]